MSFSKELIAGILEQFEMVESPRPGLVSVLREVEPTPGSQLVLCTYGRHRYMILQDQLAPTSEALTEVFEDALLIPSTGHIAENPHAASPEDEYTVSLNGTQYYLWVYDKDE